MKKKFIERFGIMPEIFKNEHSRLVALLLVAMAIVSDVLAFTFNWIFGIVFLLVVVLVVIGAFISLTEIKAQTSDYISDLTYRIQREEQDALIRMPIGILLLNDESEIAWVNPYLQSYFGKADILGRQLAEVDPELIQLIQDNLENKKSVEVQWHEKYFNLLIQKEMKAVYLLDITRYAEIQKQFEDSQLVLGQVFLDNYDEVTKSLNDTEISNLDNFVANTLSNWAQKFGMFLKKVDEDRYFILAYTGSLAEIEKEKFKILDIIREKTSKGNSPLTLSVGIAYGDSDLAELSDQSQNNLDLALGRGGDQVVVRQIDGQARFYGGTTDPMAKRTRVRARMISQALRDLMGQSKQIFVMGHQRPDMDSIGACLGIRRIAAMNKKQCWIVIDQENLHSDVTRLMEELKKDDTISATIISSEEAVAKATQEDLLIMADHSKRSMAASPDLYDQLENRLMVIDHHRRGEEFPENPMLVYIEPYASSTCELITEMFEYQSRESEPINRVEATAMLTGIVVDTQSFSQHTGTRTFDAASYLRALGADQSLSSYFMKENVASYMNRSHLIDRVEFMDDGNAICAGENDRDYDPVTAAQAADSLLDVSGVEASYAITRRSEGVVGISARSSGKRNVQLIMEQMGGGGHLAVAATQIKDTTVSEVRKQLLELLQAKTAERAEEEKTE